MTMKHSGSGWSYAAPASGLSNTTTAVTIKAAVTGQRHFITTIELWSDAITTASEFCIRDGAGGTVLWRTKIPTAGYPYLTPVNFDEPLVGTAGNLLEIVTLTATGTGNIYFNAQGYTAP